MQWSDVSLPPTPRLLRQFAGLSLAVFGGLAVWRASQGTWDVWTWAWACVALAVGVVGLVVPTVVRPIFTGWMIVAFPIGWVISRVMLAALFFLMFTPLAFVFRSIGRDVLGRRRRPTASYWTAKSTSADPGQYFRQF